MPGGELRLVWVGAALGSLGPDACGWKVRVSITIVLLLSLYVDTSVALFGGFT